MLCERSETLAQQLESLLPAGRVATAGMKASPVLRNGPRKPRSALRFA